MLRTPHHFRTRPMGVSRQIGTRRAGRKTSLLATMFIAAAFMSACSDGREGPFLTAQLCVQNRAGMQVLVDDLKVIAKARGMSFKDNSDATKRDLETVGYAARERSDGSPVLNVAVGDGDGLSVGATNLGLPGYQVALGFSEGSDATKTSRFAEEVLAQIGKRWSVERLPQGVGALPQAGCR